MANQFSCISISHSLKSKYLSLLTTREAQAAVVVSVAAFLVHIHLYPLFFHVSLIVVVVFQVPDWRPTILSQVFLVFGMKELERFRRVTANAVVIDTEVRHAPFS